MTQLCGIRSRSRWNSTNERTNEPTEPNQTKPNQTEPTNKQTNSPPLAIPFYPLAPTTHTRKHNQTNNNNNKQQQRPAYPRFSEGYRPPPSLSTTTTIITATTRIRIITTTTTMDHIHNNNQDLNVVVDDGAPLLIKTNSKPKSLHTRLSAMSRILKGLMWSKRWRGKDWSLRGKRYK